MIGEDDETVVARDLEGLLGPQVRPSTCPGRTACRSRDPHRSLPQSCWAEHECVDHVLTGTPWEYPNLVEAL